MEGWESIEELVAKITKENVMVSIEPSEEEDATPSEPSAEDDTTPIEPSAEDVNLSSVEAVTVPNVEAVNVSSNVEPNVSNSTDGASVVPSKINSSLGKVTSRSAPTRIIPGASLKRVSRLSLSANKVSVPTKIIVGASLVPASLTSETTTRRSSSKSTKVSTSLVPVKVSTVSVAPTKVSNSLVPTKVTPRLVRRTKVSAPTRIIPGASFAFTPRGSESSSSPIVEKPKERSTRKRRHFENKENDVYSMEELTQYSKTLEKESKKSLKKRPFYFATSGLNQEEIRLIKTTMGTLGGNISGDMAFSSNTPTAITTHLICNWSNQRDTRRTPRTVKYMLAKSALCWIVDISWIMASKAAGMWLDAAFFEVAGDTSINPHLCLSNLSRYLPGSPPLLQNQHLLLYGNFSAPSITRGPLLQLALLNGAECSDYSKKARSYSVTVDNIPSKGAVTVCLLSDEVLILPKVDEDVPMVKTMWLFDSISAGVLLPMELYTLENISLRGRSTRSRDKV